MAVTDVSFLRHCYRYSCNTAVALQVRAIYILIVFIYLFLSIRAFNSAGKHMASFCSFRMKVEVQNHIWIVIRVHYMSTDISIKLYSSIRPIFGEE